jgi:nitroimidazol reductase NimA-like FMN-containing flavoprotein (pyridoxamine 5'-phosphate oxidase superfamily)
VTFSKKGEKSMAGEWVKTVDYPQAPTMTEEEFVSLLEEVLFARLGTHNENGTIHITPGYFKYQDGQILMATQDPSRKARNIKRDNKVSVLIDSTDIPYRGALVYGTAELDYEDVIEKRIDIFERTRSREDGKDYARRLSNKWQCVIIRITPDHIVSFDYSKF